MKVQLIKSLNGTNEWLEAEIGVHKCTEKDWSKFYQPSQNNKHKMGELKHLQVMMCMDERDSNNQTFKKYLWGKDENSPHQRLEFMMVACKPNSTNKVSKKLCLNDENQFDKTMS